MHNPRRLLFGLAFVAVGGCTKQASDGAITMLNASHDPTRELYADVNAAFAAEWSAKSGKKLEINMSHGGSGKQARSVIDGLEADVVTLALAYDVEAVSKAGFIAPGWEGELPDHSAPYTSTIVFLVRSGNPKGIKDWDDLIKEGVGVITPNPKTSGGARWNYLAAYAFSKKKLGSVEAAREFLRKLFKNVPVLDSGARGSTTTFTERGIGDVLLAWENEALLAVEMLGKDKLEVVVPSLSILAEPSVAVVDKVVDRRGTREAAEAYLKFLGSEAGQKLAAKHGYRPRNQAILQENAAKFPTLTLVRIDDLGGWDAVQAEHFGDGGVFDKLVQPVQ